MNATESGSDRQFTGRDTSRKRLLRAVAAQTAALSAAVHFLWAWPRLAEPADARPYVFLLGGAFTVAIAVATLRADEYRRLYALGAGTLAAFLAGYAGWHGGGTRGSARERSARDRRRVRRSSASPHSSRCTGSHRQRALWSNGRRKPRVARRRPQTEARPSAIQPQATTRMRAHERDVP